MPKEKLSETTPDPGWFNDELRIHGGLKGRFAGDFCLLFGVTDALERYLHRCDSPDIRDTVIPLLQEMRARLFCLDRLSVNTSELIDSIHTASPITHMGWELQDITAFLEEMCFCANDELQHYVVTGGMTLVTKDVAGPLLVEFDLDLAQSVFANLFSNSLCADPSAEISITCKDYLLEYRDGLQWPRPARGQLAGISDPELNALGRIGLLLVHSAAQQLGWQLEAVQEASCTVLRIYLPKPPERPFNTYNVLTSRRTFSYSLAARLRQEFRATLPRRDDPRTLSGNHENV